jgi:hypothetical protein
MLEVLSLRLYIKTLYSSHSNFRRVLNIVFLLFGASPSSEFYVPMFRNTLSHLRRRCKTVYTADEDGTDRLFRNVGT